jgi:hypothetical protein
VNAFKRLFSKGGGRGSRVVSQNRAAKMGAKTARGKAVRLPVAPATRTRGGASSGGSSGS